MNLMNKSDTFLNVVQSNKGIIYKVANSYCKDVDDREDLVQEIIIQLWKSFDDYNRKFQYTTWIYKIALNVAITFYRKESRRKVFTNPIPDGILFISDDGPDDLGEDINLLQSFIKGLKELERALMLLYLEEKSYKEIAEIIGISETNVATKISRIKQVLRQKFEQINNR